jgi:hypothetical protein
LVAFSVRPFLANNSFFFETGKKTFCLILIKEKQNMGWQEPQKKKEKAGKKNPPLKDTNTISL